MDIERLGAFYLGKEYDVNAGRLLDRLLMLDARDLTTHAVCVGMTGSGKTGLGIALLEEAAIDHVPAIIIDPKGDITNLLLTFPEMRPEDLRPWINVDEARRRQLGEEEYAAQQADLWRNGLAAWGQGATRTLLLREAADQVIYTPGSDAGVPVSILRSFAAPKLGWDEEAELLRELIQGTVSALLGLTGAEADPVRSREHILLANILEHAWRQGQDMDLPRLIAAIQNPPFRQLGVMEVNAFFPEKERFRLAMAINNLIAAPSFQGWLHGQLLDVASFLATPAGKPRHSIFYIAHLSDAERMFFVSMLLNQVLTWARAQPGTNSLRALLYMDEIFGFFPPVANPPSKAPMLALLKQARAYGLGVVLTTQNPVDLDYKGLANTGTWFIGRLRTEQDKGRLLDGLAGASTAAGRSVNAESLGRIISRLQGRVFLLHSIYADTPVTFQTRWTMSYLRGPLTRTQIRQLMKGRRPDEAAPPPVHPPIPARPAALAPEELPAPEEEPAASAEPTVVPSRQPRPAPEEEPEEETLIPEESAVPLRRSRPEEEVGATRASPRVEEAATPAPAPAAPGQLLQVAPPPLPASIEQVYLPVRRPAEKDARLVYVAAVLGMGTVDFADRPKKVQAQERFALLAPSGGLGREMWEQAQPVEIALRDLADRPAPGALFVKLPTTMDEVAEINNLKKALVDFLYANWSVTVLYSPALEMYSQPDESRRDFRQRLQQLARERRDQELDEIADYYEERLGKLDERLRRAEATLAKKEADARARDTEAWVSIGESVFGVFGGRRRTYRALSTYVSKRRLASQRKMDVDAQEETLQSLEQQIAALEEKGRREIEEVQTRWEKTLTDLQEVPIKPRRADIRVELFALAWTPYWATRVEGEGGRRIKLAPAF